MELNGKPNKNTSGTLGEICTDTTTNKQYKCICIYKISIDNTDRLEYQWELVSDDSGSGGDAKSVNGYSIWVGTTAELEALDTKDSNTLYFEKGDE